jgi:hypothetical protein
VNPPFSAMNLAALLAAATIDGSSTAIGILYFLPFIRKFKLILK